MIVKICGLQEVADVRAAVAAGADMIGFVFAASTRQITLQQAKILAKEVPAKVQKVGVFVNPTVAEVEKASREVPLDVIQLHGQETAAFVAKLSRPVIKALPFKVGQEARLINSYPANTILLLDGPAQEFAGGSGQVFNWQAVDLATMPQKRLLLAGGLTPDNVERAIAHFQPMGVDVSSGVETAGKKDAKKIHQFIRMAKGEG